MHNCSMLATPHQSHYKGNGEKMQVSGKPKVKGDTRAYKWQKTVSLTKPEGETMDKILADNGCKNLSQFCKKIVHGEPVHW